MWRERLSTHTPGTYHELFRNIQRMLEMVLGGIKRIYHKIPALLCLWIGETWIDTICVSRYHGTHTQVWKNDRTPLLWVSQMLGSKHKPTSQTWKHLETPVWQESESQGCNFSGSNFWGWIFQVVQRGCESFGSFIGHFARSKRDRKPHELQSVDGKQWLGGWGGWLAEFDESSGKDLIFF